MEKFQILTKGTIFLEYIDHCSGIWSSAHHKADGDKVNVTINNYDDIVIIVVVGDNKTKYDDEHEVINARLDSPVSVTVSQ